MRNGMYDEFISFIENDISLTKSEKLRLIEAW
jgi:hypothetical protein